MRIGSDLNSKYLLDKYYYIEPDNTVILFFYDKFFIMISQLIRYQCITVKFLSSILSVCKNDSQIRITFEKKKIATVEKSSSLLYTKSLEV